MTKQYELYYYTQTGLSNPMRKIEDVADLLFQETGQQFAAHELKEGTMYQNGEGDLIILESFEDGSPDEEEEGQ